MTINIPSDVFSKYEEFADAMIADFGVACKLVYIEQVQEITESVPRAKQRRTMDIQDRNDPAGFARGSDTYKTVENTENITLRVYWNKKDWVKIGDLNLPDGAIQTIGYLTDLTKINKAASLIVNSDNDGYREFRFVKAAEPTPWGLQKDRYCVCHWKRE